MEFFLDILTLIEWAVTFNMAEFLTAKSRDGNLRILILNHMLLNQ